MYNNFINTNNDFFSNLVKNETNEHKVVGYSEFSHLKRFSKLLELVNLEDKKILDIGCGAGGLYNFLKNKINFLDYLGIDINQDMINLSQRKFPEISKKFVLCNIFENELSYKPDIVVSIGALNLKFDNNQNDKIIKEFLRKAFEIAGETLAISMTSKFATKHNDITYYYDPISILEYISTFCKFFVIDHSFLANDFFVVLRKSEN